MWIVEAISCQCCELQDLIPIGKVVDRNVPRHVKCKVCGTQYINQPEGVITNSLTEKFGLGYSKYSPTKVYDLECYKKLEQLTYSSIVNYLEDFYNSPIYKDLFKETPFMSYLKHNKPVKFESTPIKNPIDHYTPNYYSKWVIDKDFDI